MEILVLSDLHIEFKPLKVDLTGADVVVLAGDIHVNEDGLKWAVEQLEGLPVFYVLGNHEYYGSSCPNLIAELKDKAAGTNVHILENDVVSVDGVNFLGCTLWTDFALYGDQNLSAFYARRGLNDFRYIGDESGKLAITPQATIDIFGHSVSWLGQALASRKGKKNVVVTHHAPSARSIPGIYVNDVLSPALASNLDAFVEEYSPSLWIHGHVHQSFDYMIGETRVICNSRGYPSEETGFRADLKISV